MKNNHTMYISISVSYSLETVCHFSFGVMQCGPLIVFQAQVCSMTCTERVHWTINNDINVWQIKWLVNNLLTALTSEPLSGIDQAAVPGFVWQEGSIWFLLGWMERDAQKTFFCFLSCVWREQKSKQGAVHHLLWVKTFNIYYTST